MAPTKNRTRPTDAANPIGGIPIPNSSPSAPATEIRGAWEVAQETLTNSRRARFAQPILVNGALGIVVGSRGKLDLVLRLTIKNDRITEIEVIADHARLHRLDLAVFDPVTSG
jgi:hypothetical protein